MSESDSIDLSQLQNLQFRPDWVEDLAQKDTAEVVWGKVSPDVMRREREGGDRFGGRGQRDDRRGGGGGGHKPEDSSKGPQLVQFDADRLGWGAGLVRVGRGRVGLEVRGLVGREGRGILTIAGRGLVGLVVRGRMDRDRMGRDRMGRHGGIARRGMDGIFVVGRGRRIRGRTGAGRVRRIVVMAGKGLRRCVGGNRD